MKVDFHWITFTAAWVVGEAASLAALTLTPRPSAVTRQSWMTCTTSPGPWGHSHPHSSLHTTTTTQETMTSSNLSSPGQEPSGKYQHTSCNINSWPTQSRCILIFLKFDFKVFYQRRSGGQVWLLVVILGKTFGSTNHPQTWNGDEGVTRGGREDGLLICAMVVKLG